MNVQEKSALDNICRSGMLDMLIVRKWHGFLYLYSFGFLSSLL